MQAEGVWWRFDRYQVRDGYIRPAPRASLEQYDPWKAYWNQTQVPASALVDLVQNVEPKHFLDPWPPTWKPTHDQEFEIARFCEQYGLLGTLLHELLSIRLGPHMLARTPNGWEERGYFYEAGEEHYVEIVKMEMDGQATTSNEKGDWYRYFPHISREEQDRLEHEWSAPPVPPSTEFWQAYAEPIREFMVNARWFANAIQVLAGEPSAKIVEGRESALDRAGAVERLQRLMTPVTLGLQLAKGRYHQLWRSPSLLGHLAMQAVEDLLGKRRRWVTCPACDKVVPTTHHRKRFCSERCASRYRQQQQRKRDAKRMERK